MRYWYATAALVGTLLGLSLALDNLAPCPTEDSANCLWLADDNGNGQGMSFIDVGGNIIIRW